MNESLASEVSGVECGNLKVEYVLEHDLSPWVMRLVSVFVMCVLHLCRGISTHMFVPYMIIHTLLL